MKSIGILLDPDTGDLQVSLQRDARGLIAQGLEVGEVTCQNQAIILQANKGEFKEFPTLGIGISGLANDHETTEWRRKITMQLTAEGMRVNNVEIDITNGKLIIDAQYRT